VTPAHLWREPVGLPRHRQGGRWCKRS